MISRSSSASSGVGSLAPEPVLPHYLEMRGPSEDGVFSNMAMRIGEVQELIPPDDPRNLSKKFIEYRVLVQHMDSETLTGSSREYSHCVLINPFGGLADRAYWRLRADSQHKDDTGLGKGSKVLMMCVNGEHNSAVILGGVRDEADEGDADLFRTGVRFMSEMNGVRFVITNNGEASLVHYGPTEIDGKTVEGTPDDVVSGFSLFSDGSALIGARNKRGDAAASQRIEIVQPERKVKLIADNGIHVGAATEEWPLFATYRRAEQQMHATVVSLLTTMATINETMATAMKATSVLHVIPIVGPILAAPALGQISVQMTAVTALINAAIAAIQSFEARAASYLSRKNKND